MKDKIEIMVSEALGTLGVVILKDGTVNIERSTDLSHGDYATSVALVYCKKIGVSSRELAGQIVEKILETPSEVIEKIEVAGPGFINFFLTSSALEQAVFESPMPRQGKKEKVNIEFISTNPTGELHIGHGRSEETGFWPSLAPVISSRYCPGARLASWKSSE